MAARSLTLEQRLGRHTVVDLRAMVWHLGDVEHPHAAERCKDPLLRGSKPELISWMVDELKDDLIALLPIPPSTLNDWRTAWHRVTDATKLARAGELQQALLRKDAAARLAQEQKHAAGGGGQLASVDAEAKRLGEDAKGNDIHEEKHPQPKRLRPVEATIESMTCTCGNVQPLSTAMDLGCLRCGAAPPKRRAMDDAREEKHLALSGRFSSSQLASLSMPSASARIGMQQQHLLDISQSRVPSMDLAPLAKSILDKAREGQTYIPIDSLMPRKRTTSSAAGSGLAVDDYETVIAVSSTSNRIIKVAEGERLTMSVARTIDGLAGIVEIIVHQLIGVVYRDSPIFCGQLFGLLSVVIDVDRIYGWKVARLYVDSVLEQRLVRAIDVRCVQYDLLSNAASQITQSQLPNVRATAAPSSSSSTASGKSSTGVCYKWNLGVACANTPCPFTHNCRSCHGNHRQSECPVKKPGKSNKKEG